MILNKPFIQVILFLLLFLLFSYCLVLDKRYTKAKQQTEQASVTEENLVLISNGKSTQIWENKNNANELIIRRKRDYTGILVQKLPENKFIEEIVFCENCIKQDTLDVSPFDYKKYNIGDSLNTLRHQTVWTYR